VGQFLESAGNDPQDDSFKNHTDNYTLSVAVHESWNGRMVGASITVVVVLSADCHGTMITAAVGGAWTLQETNVRNSVGKYVYVCVCLIKKCGYVPAQCTLVPFLL